MTDPKQPDGLISVLFDTKAKLGDRLDAAMDLGSHDEPEAEQALLRIVLDPKADEDLADEAGNSICEIWSRQEKFDADIVARMHPEARKFFE